MLQRMRELAVQSANGTYTDVNRHSMQLEFANNIAEIENIRINTEDPNYTQTLNFLQSINPTNLTSLYNSISNIDTTTYFTQNVYTSNSINGLFNNEDTKQFLRETYDIEYNRLKEEMKAKYPTNKVNERTDESFFKSGAIAELICCGKNNQLAERLVDNPNPNFQQFDMLVQTDRDFTGNSVALPFDLFDEDADELFEIKDMRVGK
jgi:flagellin-like hook-associated protein FlgL